MKILVPLIVIFSLAGPANCTRVLADPIPVGYPESITVGVAGGGHSGDYVMTWDDGLDGYDLIDPAGYVGGMGIGGVGSITEVASGDDLSFSGDWDGSAWAFGDPVGNGSFGGSSVSAPESSAAGVAAGFFLCWGITRWRSEPARS